MKSRSAISRILLLLLALVQLGAPPLATIADAALNESGLSTRAAQHVEGERSSSCPELHHDQCALCPVVAGLFVRAERQPLAVPAEVAMVGFASPRVGVHGAGLSSSHAPRAPPV